MKKRVLAVIICLSLLGSVACGANTDNNINETNLENDTSETNGEKEESQFEYLEACDVGDYIEFGNFEQDNDSSNGKEPIEWIVVFKEDNYRYLISKECLFREVYSVDGDPEEGWLGSSLRAKLNVDFYEEAFNDLEKDLISEQEYTSEERIYGEDVFEGVTNEKVTILNYSELEGYLSAIDMSCDYTTFCLSQCDEMLAYQSRRYWERNVLLMPNSGQLYGTTTSVKGESGKYGWHLDQESGVRPFIVVDVKGDQGVEYEYDYNLE